MCQVSSFGSLKKKKQKKKTMFSSLDKFCIHTRGVNLHWSHDSIRLQLSSHQFDLIRYIFIYMYVCIYTQKN